MYPEIDESRTEHVPWLIVLVLIIVHRLYSGTFLFPIPKIPSIAMGGVLFFVGISILSSIKSYQTESEEKIWKKGAYSYVRHPEYSSIVFLLLGLSFITQHLGMLAFTLATFLLLYKEIEREEKDLLEEYPKQYKKYKEKVSKRFFPKLL